MHNPATLEFASALVADSERHWLYGHPYRPSRGPRASRAARRAPTAPAAPRPRASAAARGAVPPPRPRRLSLPSMARVQRVSGHRRRR